MFYYNYQIFFYMSVKVGELSFFHFDYALKYNFLTKNYIKAIYANIINYYFFNFDFVLFYQ